MLNADLVLNGYAEPSTYIPDVKYSAYFVKFAREARDQHTGLWAFGDEGTTKGDLDSTTASNSNSSNFSSSTSPNLNTITTELSASTTESYQNRTELRKVY